MRLVRFASASSNWEARSDHRDDGERHDRRPERFLAVGMDEYVTKPISPDRLREVLMALVRRPPLP